MRHTSKPQRTLPMISLNLLLAALLMVPALMATLLLINPADVVQPVLSSVILDNGKQDWKQYRLSGTYKGYRGRPSSP